MTTPDRDSICQPMKVNYIYLLLLLLPAISWAEDYERRLSETFSIKEEGRVRLENRYGEINVETWDRSEVKIDVLIKVNARSQEAADKVFDRINVDLSGGGSSVSAVTSINSGRSSARSWWNLITGGGSSSSDFKIYYKVRMPASVDLDTEARYCDVVLPDLNGETKVTVRYGDLVAGRLSNRNEVEISYGSARIEELGRSSQFRIRYSEGVIRKAGQLRYDGRYSDTRMGKVGKLTIDAGYEELEIEEATECSLQGSYNELDLGRCGRVFLDGNYCDFTLGTITKELEVEAKYGDLEIDELLPEFEWVYIRTGYIDVDIDVHSEAGYELDLRTRYGDIDVDTDELSNRNYSKDGTSRSLTGKKSGRGNGKIDIETSYGDIEID